MFDKILSNSSTDIVGLNSLLLKQLTTACICDKMEAKRFQSRRKRNTREYKDIQGRFQLCDFSAWTDILPPEKTERSDTRRQRKLPLHRRRNEELQRYSVDNPGGRAFGAFLRLPVRPRILQAPCRRAHIS